ncbi:hypothetical protein D9M73_243230 [compost metagenome]
MVVVQSLGKGSQALTALPLQRKFVERAQAGGIQRSQAQASELIFPVRKVELAKGGENGLDPRHRQVDPELLVISTAAGVERHGDLAVGGFRTAVQQIGALADQAE